jgi:O-antigen/teichoic acid export membrane protein
MSAARNRPVIISLTVGLLQRLAQFLGALVIVPLVLHAIGPDGFGIWGAAASLLWMTATLDFGIGNALLTVMAHRHARGEPEQARTEATAGLLLASCVALVELAAALVAICMWVPAQERAIYLIAAISLGVNIPVSLANRIWSGLQKSYTASGWETAQTLVSVSGLYLLTRLTGDVRLYVAITCGGLLLANFGSLIHLFLSHAELRPRWPLPNRRLFVDLLRRGVPYVLLGLSFTLAVQSDNIVALSLLGSEPAARMAVAQRVSMTAFGLLWVVSQPLWPAFADAAASGDHVWVYAYLVRGMALLTACAAAGSAILLIFGRPVLDLWLHGGLTLGQDVLWAMAALIVVSSLSHVPDLLLNALGVVWFQVAVALVSSGLAFALKVALAPRLGVAGILLATAISYGLTYLPAYLWWVWRWMRLKGPASRRIP